MAIDPKGVRSSVTGLQRQLARAQADATRLGAEAEALQKQITAMRDSGQDPSVLSGQLAAIQRGQLAAATTAEQVVVDLHGELATFHGQEFLPYSTVDPHYPVVMLPVRLETRFAAGAHGPELRVRIMPDDPHIDTFEPELTPDELSNGEAFWVKVWRAGGETTRERQAWKDLVAVAGVYRAGYIAQLVKPNGAGRPTAPVPDGTPLPVQPVFNKAIPMRAAAMTRPSWVTALPDRFVAVAQLVSAPLAVAWGHVIPPQLEIGFDPNKPPVSTSPDRPALDPGLQWMVDFTEAENSGMAIRVPLPAGTTAVARLIVVGVKDSLDPAAGEEILRTLLQSHAYTRGLSFLPPGTPTNNTPTDKSAWTAKPGSDDLFATLIDPPRVTDPMSNVQVAASALGVSAADWPSLRNAEADAARGAHAMNTAMWMPTWGYFLRQLVRPETGASPLTDDQISLLRRHYIDNVIGQGVLPTLRIGDQPYGLLPVTSLTRWTSSPDNPLMTVLAGTLCQLRQFWSAGIAQVPNMETGDPEDQLVKALCMSARSVEIWVRSVIGRNYSHAVGALGLPGLSYLVDAQGQLMDAVTRAVGWKFRPSLADCALLPDAVELRLPWSATRAGADGDTEVDDVLKHLISTDLSTLETEAVNLAAPMTLFNILARYASLLENGVQALSVAQPGRSPSARLESSDVINLDLGAGAPTPQIASTTETLKSALVAPAPSAPGLTMAQYLRRPEVVEGFPDLAEFNRALDALQNRGAAELERLLANSLDCASHRFDAWVTSLASQRLSELRVAHPTGAYVGAFGWVEDIRAAPAATPVAAPVGETGPVAVDPGNAGYVLAPSIGQAATAAVLRSGHISHASRAGAGALAVDLSSARMRRAVRILDGVRAGQQLGALLGYQVERDLHDAGLDAAIDPLRRLAPERAGKLTPTRLGEAVESIDALGVVDGLALSRLDPSSVGSALTEAGLPAELDQVFGIIGRLRESVDAIADLMLAEGVYQLVHGNADRVAATLDAINLGDLEPPEPHVLQTPRSGVAVQQRIAVLLGSQTPIPRWPAGGGQRNRAAAEPRLEVWAQRMLPPPATVRVRASFPTATGRVLTELSLADMRLSALDVICDSYGASGTSVLEQRLAYRIAFSPPAGALSGAVPNLVHARDPAWTADVVDLDQLLAISGFVRDVAMSGTAGSADNFGNPGDPAASGIDTGELNARAYAALSALTAAAGAVDALVAADTSATSQALVGALDALASFGVIAQDLGLGASRADLLTHATTAATTGHGRLAAANAAVPAGGLPPDDSGAAALAVLHAVFGESFPVLAVFSLPRPGFASALGAQTQLLRDPAHDARDWLMRVGRVRKRAGLLDRLLIASSALATGTAYSLRVAQMPFDPTDTSARWVGGQVPAMPAQVMTSFVVQMDPAIDFTAPVASLLVDDWVEVIPDPRQVAALAFQADAPCAQAPQAILLAVSPDPSTPWTVDRFAAVLNETLDLVKMRGVDLEAATWAGRMLPAIYLAHNTLGDTFGVNVKQVLGVVAGSQAVNARLV